MADLTWQDAIRKVLGSSTTALHYREITDRILERGLKKKIGATPTATVNALISASIKRDGENSPYRRVEKGTYLLSAGQPTPAPVQPEENGEVVISFGAFWERDKVVWKTKPSLYGVLQTGGASKVNPTRVDFCGQHGVYLLHDVREVIYVGRTTKGDLGKRLYDHTRDRLQGRWSRFSWFGFRPVSETGKLSAKMQALPDEFGMDNLIATMEAILIEALEPRQNRQVREGIEAMEYRQVVDPAIEKKAMRDLFERMMREQN